MVHHMGLIQLRKSEEFFPSSLSTVFRKQLRTVGSSVRKHGIVSTSTWYPLVTTPTGLRGCNGCL